MRLLKPVRISKFTTVTLIALCSKDFFPKLTYFSRNANN
jgi:hypothetical protein